MNVNVTVACPFPLVAVPIVGASGVVAGVTELLTVEDALVPNSFVAVTVNVYATPLVKPSTIAESELLVAVCAPLEVIV